MLETAIRFNTKFEGAGTDYSENIRRALADTEGSQRRKLSIQIPRYREIKLDEGMHRISISRMSPSGVVYLLNQLLTGGRTGEAFIEELQEALGRDKKKSATNVFYKKNFCFPFIDDPRMKVIVDELARLIIKLDKPDKDKKCFDIEKVNSSNSKESKIKLAIITVLDQLDRFLSGYSTQRKDLYNEKIENAFEARVEAEQEGDAALELEELWSNIHARIKHEANQSRSLFQALRNYAQGKKSELVIQGTKPKLEIIESSRSHKPFGEMPLKIDLAA